MEPNGGNAPVEFQENHNLQDNFDAEEWDFKEILVVLVHHRWFVIFCVLGFLSLSIAYALLCPRTYSALCTVELPSSASGTANTAIRDLASLPSTGDPIQTYIDVAKSNTIAAYVIQKLDLLNNPQFEKFSILKLKTRKPSLQSLSAFLIKKIVGIKNSADSDILGIQVDVKNDPKLAANLANAWAEGFININLAISQESARRQYAFVHDQLSIMRNKLERDRLVKKNYLNPSNEAQSDEIIYNLLLQQDQQTQIQANADTSGIVVVDKAQVPEGPTWPSMVICVIIGLFLGFGIGAQGAILLDKFQDRIKADADLNRATGLTLLAHVPNFRRENGKLVFSPTDLFSRKHLISDDHFQFSSYRESFKVFRTNFTFSNVDHRIKTLGVLSASSGEGKTLVNADLALSLAEMGKKVLLVDADLRKPTVSVLFGATTNENIGLPQLLTGKGKLEDMIVESGFPNLFLLPNGTIPPNPAELLGSESLKRVVGEMKSKFDYVVFDGAPILPVTDSVVMATQLDGVILLGRWDRTRRSEFRRAFKQLRSVGARVLGSVLNAAEIHRGLYGYYGYGSGYGYGYGNYGKKPKKTEQDPKDPKKS